MRPCNSHQDVDEYDINELTVLVVVDEEDDGDDDNDDYSGDGGGSYYRPITCLCHFN